MMVAVPMRLPSATSATNEPVTIPLSSPAPLIPSGLSEALQCISASLARPTSLADTLTLIVNQALRCLACDQAGIYLAEPGSAVLALCAVAGAEQLSATVYHLRPGQGTPGQALMSGHSQQTVDFQAAGASRAALGLANTRSELSVPIWNGDLPTGALMVSSKQPAAFGEAAAQALALLAAQAAVAMRLEDISLREAERAVHSHLLTEISLSVNSTLDLDHVLQQAVSRVAVGLRADRSTLSQAHQATGVFHTAIEYVNPLLSERRSLTNEKSVLQHTSEVLQLLQAGQVITACEDEVPPVLRAVWPELASRYGIRSLVWVPIPTSTAATQEFYSLRLLQVTHARRWTEAELELLRGIAGQLAMALNNAHLFHAQLQTARELQDRNNELQSLVYSVSHDLQAPIVSVSGFANLLQARHAGQLDERGLGYVGRIVANAEYLTQLLNDLLELSRVGRIEEPVEQVEVGPLIDLILAQYTSSAAYAAVRVVRSADWPVVTYSRTRLRQVFSNLVSNAFKFMGPQPAPRVELSWQEIDAGPGAGRLIEFSVQDNGIGIHPDYHQRIFGTFERLKQVDVAGTGIGLSIVKRIVESRGGTVRLESALGAGSTFHFTVPVASPPGGAKDGERAGHASL